MQCICTNTCFFNDRLYQPGEVVDLAVDKAPLHFQAASEQKEQMTRGFTSNQLMIRRALMSMDRNDSKLWTNAGKPQVRVVSSIAGFDVSRDEIEAAFPGFERDVQPFKDVKADFLT